MKVVDRHIINRTHNFWRVCDELAKKLEKLVQRELTIIVVNIFSSVQKV